MLHIWFPFWHCNAAAAHSFQLSTSMIMTWPAEIDSQTYLEPLLRWSCAEIEINKTHSIGHISAYARLHLRSPMSCGHAQWQCNAHNNDNIIFEAHLLFAIVELLGTKNGCIHVVRVCSILAVLKSGLKKWLKLCSMTFANKTVSSCWRELLQRLYLHRITATVITWVNSWQLRAQRNCEDADAALWKWNHGKLVAWWKISQAEAEQLICEKNETCYSRPLPIFNCHEVLLSLVMLCLPLQCEKNRHLLDSSPRRETPSA